MLNRRHVIGATVLTAVLGLGQAAHAMSAKRYNAKEFEAAQAEGKSILVEVHAPWCPVCRAQAPILEKLSGQPKYKGVVRFVIDFDSQKDALRKLNVQRQSTLISFKGKRETGRSTGDTDAATIEALVAKSI